MVLINGSMNQFLKYSPTVQDVEWKSQHSLETKESTPGPLPLLCFQKSNIFHTHQAPYRQMMNRTDKLKFVKFSFHKKFIYAVLRILYKRVKTDTL